jgi:hypothetical protein
VCALLLYSDSAFVSPFKRRWQYANSTPCSVVTAPTGTLFRASQFLSEELPIRLAHRVKELGDLPDGLNEMPSIRKVQEWYAQSFEVGIEISCFGSDYDSHIWHL